MPLGAKLRAMQQIAFAHDANHAATRVNNWRATDALLREQRRQAPHRQVRFDRDHVRRHYVHCSHVIPPGCRTCLNLAETWPVADAGDRTTAIAYRTFRRTFVD